jgi:hypothetical protein
MSFIVEATQRQQQETVPAEAALLALERVRRRERRIWLIVGILTATGIALTSAIIIKWFVLEPSTTSAVSETTYPTIHSSAEAITSIEDVGSDTTWYQPMEPSTEPETQSLTTPEAPRIEDNHFGSAEDAAPPPRDVLRLQDAPEESQQTLLAFRYTAHLHTSEPTKRSMTVNGKRIREGEAIGEWALVEITANGAVWDNGEILVDVPVLDLWL